MKFKLAFLTIVLALAAACSMGGYVETGAADSPSSVANGGYDSVAYFAVDKATKGNTQFSYVFRGAKWLFSNSEHLEKFKSNPDQYVPQFGSHCPVSLANGGKEDGSPTVWKVVDEKLYLFSSEDNKREFENNREKILSKASETYKSDAN